MRVGDCGRVAVAVAVAVGGLLAAGCGDQEKQARIPGTPDPAHAREVDRNPYAVTCGDLARQPEHPDSEHLVIRAEFALAMEPALRERAREMTLNRTGRSVYWGADHVLQGPWAHVQAGEAGSRRRPAGRVPRAAPAGVVEPPLTHTDVDGAREALRGYTADAWTPCTLVRVTFTVRMSLLPVLGRHVTRQVTLL